MELCLAIDDYVLANQPFEIDAKHLATEGQIHPVVDESLPLHASAEPRVCEYLAGSVFNDSGSDPLEHMLLGAKLEHDTLDPFEVKEVGK